MIWIKKILIQNLSRPPRGNELMLPYNMYGITNDQRVNVRKKVENGKTGAMPLSEQMIA